MLGSFQDWKLGVSFGFMPLRRDSVVSDRVAALAAATGHTVVGRQRHQRSQASPRALARGSVMNCGGLASPLVTAGANDKG
jgi:hypothetical protein